eukprot:CAMPEP_0114271188 /NCGR_PEP_ID=MMETSP0058-20121206/27709_1 /TAXON_ID=36894 /ORGANISM="Pyramimonas parkeae, CCMP726" /LENGTH=301 /DNA_ID=CAMNT_0001390117 /DNA_START=22 /DNA_END=923 /DNA_ORIENTATION=+
MAEQVNLDHRPMAAIHARATLFAMLIAVVRLGAGVDAEAAPFERNVFKNVAGSIQAKPPSLDEALPPPKVSKIRQWVRDNIGYDSNQVPIRPTQCEDPELNMPPPENWHASPPNPPLPPGYPAFFLGYPMVTRLGDTFARVAVRLSERCVVMYAVVQSSSPPLTAAQIMDASTIPGSAGKVSNGTLTVARASSRSYQNIQNLTMGVSYRCSMVAQDLSFNIGYVSSVEFTAGDSLDSDSESKWESTTDDTETSSSDSDSASDSVGMDPKQDSDVSDSDSSDSSTSDSNTDTNTDTAISDSG